MAQQTLSEAELLKFDALGNVTLLHVADIHGQLVPVYFREPSINLGVGEAKGQPPHLTGADFLKRFGIPAKSAAAYALTVGGFHGAGQELRPHRRARPARDRGQARARRARRQGAFPRRRRHLAGLDGRQCQQRPGHGRLHGAVEARRHDRPLGIHLWRGPRHRVDQRPGLPVPRAQRSRHRMERAGVRADEDVRAAAASRSPCSARHSPIRRSPIRAG